MFALSPGDFSFSCTVWYLGQVSFITALGWQNVLCEWIWLREIQGKMSCICVCVCLHLAHFYEGCDVQRVIFVGSFLNKPSSHFVPLKLYGLVGPLFGKLVKVSHRQSL